MRPKRPKNSKRRKAALAEGFRSGFEKGIADDLTARGIKFEFEKHKFSYVRVVRGGSCGTCGSKAVGRRATYTPDFHLPGSSVWVEAKGRLLSSDRTKLKCFKEQHPGIDLRLLLQRDNTLSKLSRTKYSEWCANSGFRYAVGKVVPPDWVTSGRKSL